MTDASPAAIVTGSTSGIGLAVAKRLLAAGYKVVLNYANDQNRAQRALAECQSISRHVALIRADVADSASPARIVALALTEFGRIDVLINNAAVAIDGPALDLTPDQWDRVLDVNLRGPFLLSQAVATQMLSQTRGGTIINVGATTGIRGRRNGINTCASKAGLMMLTQCLALELAPKVRVNTVVPGLVVTDETVHRFNLNNPATRQTREAAVPMNRLGTPNDVADAVILLLSPQAAFMTGQKLFVDGGQFMS